MNAVLLGDKKLPTNTNTESACLQVHFTKKYQDAATRHRHSIAAYLREEMINLLTGQVSLERPSRSKTHVERRCKRGTLCIILTVLQSHCTPALYTTAPRRTVTCIAVTYIFILLYTRTWSTRLITGLVGPTSFDPRP